MSTTKAFRGFTPARKKGGGYNNEAVTDVIAWSSTGLAGTPTNNIFTGATAWYARFEGGTADTLPGGGWTRKDDACDASYPPDNANVGNCTDTLVSGTSCVPTCNTGYVLEGVTSCTDRVLTRKSDLHEPAVLEQLRVQDRGG